MSKKKAEENKSQRSYSIALSTKRKNTTIVKKSYLDLIIAKKSISNSSTNDKANKISTINFVKEQDILLSKPVIIKDINNNKSKIEFNKQTLIKKLENSQIQVKMRRIL